MERNKVAASNKRAGTTAQVSARSLNDLTDMADSHFISYSHVVQDQLEWVYLLRLSRPLEPIYMGIDDVSGAFKHCRLHPDVVGAYGCFTATGLLFVMSLVSIFWQNRCAERIHAPG